jgi:hypothetical protein
MKIITPLALAYLCLAATVTSRAQNTYPFPSSGNVGIGTSVPASTLDVRGNISVYKYTSGVDFSVPALLGYSYSDGSGLNIGVTGLSNRGNAGTNVGGYFAASGGANNYGLLVPSGNVGIGTASPTAKLDIWTLETTGVQTALCLNNNYYYGVGSGTAAVQLDFQRYHATKGAIRVGNEGETTSDYNYMAFSTWGRTLEERVRINSAGNVGIGTTSPERLLHVRGANGVVRIDRNSSAPGTMIARFSPDWSTVYKCFQIYVDGDGADNGCFGIGDSHQQVGGGADIRFYINNIGNVGIGTTSPTEKLSVNGKIRAKEVIVDTGWSDYVFAKGYHLASLSEVEQHIQMQGHLPGVPSAHEVAEKGVSIGDMQSVLLAKIEELTLHVISQEKQLREQAEHIKILEAGNTNKLNP